MASTQSESGASSDTDSISISLTPISANTSDTSSEDEHPGIVAWQNYADRMGQDNEEGSVEGAASWADIEDMMAITDAYDTGLSSDEQEAALWAEVETKMAEIDAYDSGI